MKVVNHWLVAENATEKVVKDPTQNQLNNITPSYLTIHYTAGDKASNAINWFKDVPPTNPDRIAAHIVVDVDGTITQLVPFNRRANHAGYSTWDGLTGFNLNSIGIEIVNPGFVEKMADGSFKRWLNKKQNKFVSYPASTASKLVHTNHKHKFWTDPENHYWFKFPDAQLKAVYALSKLLMTQYSLINAVGHDDLSPGRKPDPGPAFPWDEFKLNVLGRVDHIGRIFKVNSTDGYANFRTNHDTSSTVIKKLTNGTEIGLIETYGQWNKVYLVDKKSDVIDSEGKSVKSIGWVHNSLVELK